METLITTTWVCCIFIAVWTFLNWLQSKTTKPADKTPDQPVNIPLKLSPDRIKEATLVTDQFVAGLRPLQLISSLASQQKLLGEIAKKNDVALEVIGDMVKQNPTHAAMLVHDLDEASKILENYRKLIMQFKNPGDPDQEAALQQFKDILNKDKD